MKNIFRLLSFLSFLLLSTVLHAQTNNADTMRSNGRIYVVIAIIVTILTGLILYMVRVDRKIGKLEKESNS